MRPDTAITEVTTTFLSIPLDRPLVTAAFPIPAIDTALVQVRTAAGHEGVAWSFAFGRGRVASLVRLIEDLAEAVVGNDALCRESTWAMLAKRVGFIGPRGLAAIAMSTIDTACWDIAGQAAGQPVYRLLGGFRNAVETYASQGLWLDRSLDELANEARALVEQGFRAVKMRAGSGDPVQDEVRVRVVREAIGPDVGLMVDANQAWDLKQTLSMARRLEPYDLLWLEEPMPHTRVDDYRRAASQLPMPLCTGESEYLKDDMLRLARAQAADYLMPDLMRMGGVTEWVKVAHTCESFGLEITPHLFMEHSTHLAAACPNAVWQEYQPWWQPIMARPIEVSDGRIVLSDQPGFGIELADDAVAHYAL